MAIWLQQNLIFQQAIRIPTVFSILEFIVSCALTKNGDPLKAPPANPRT